MTKWSSSVLVLLSYVLQGLEDAMCRNYQREVWSTYDATSIELLPLPRQGVNLDNNHTSGLHLIWVLVFHSPLYLLAVFFSIHGTYINMTYRLKLFKHRIQRIWRTARHRFGAPGRCTWRSPGGVLWVQCPKNRNTDDTCNRLSYWFHKFVIFPSIRNFIWFQTYKHNQHACKWGCRRLILGRHWAMANRVLVNSMLGRFLLISEWSQEC